MEMYPSSPCNAFVANTGTNLPFSVFLTNERTIEGTLTAVSIPLLPFPKKNIYLFYQAVFSYELLKFLSYLHA